MDEGPVGDLEQESDLWKGEKRAACPGHPRVSSNFSFENPYVFPFSVVSSSEDGLDKSSSRTGSGCLVASAVLVLLCFVNFSVCHPQVILPGLSHQ